MPKKKLLIAVIVFLLTLSGWLAVAAGQNPSSRPVFARAAFTVTRADGVVFPFKGEIAVGEEQQAYGLMFVKHLAEDAGMIFPFTPPRPVAFWMKNTLIPLDMLFISTDGTIGRIVAEARPQDLTPIPSQMPVIAVIEIAGGIAKKDGLAVGDRINSSSLTAISP